MTNNSIQARLYIPYYEQDPMEYGPICLKMIFSSTSIRSCMSNKSVHSPI